ncbi:MAG: addiction module protein, partial [Edaphobacter sp.]
MLSYTEARHKFHSMPYPAPDITRMTVGERLALIDQVWDDAERAVFEGRRAEHRADPATAIPWMRVLMTDGF